MYEAKLSSAFSGQPTETGVLRGLAWDELAAKLAAARDLRRVFAAPRGDSPASFASGAARALALGEGTGERGKEYVNPDALGAGKGPGATTPAAAREAGDCDREMR